MSQTLTVLCWGYKSEKNRHSFYPYKVESPIKETVQKIVKCNVETKNTVIFSDWKNVRGAYSLEFSILIS